MRKINKSILTMTAILFFAASYAQVGIGTTTPDTNAEIDITSTNRGVLLPRLALTGTANVAPLSAHVAGMITYNTNTAGDVTPGFYYNDGTQWIRIGSASNDWTLTGNAGTTAGANYVGTSDNVDLYLSRNGVDQIRLTAAEIKVNENSNDVDFIVESDTNANMFEVDAGNDRVIVNGAYGFVGTNLSVTSTTANDAAIFANNSTGGALYSQTTGSGDAITAIAGSGSSGGALYASNYSTSTYTITAYIVANNGERGIYVDNTFGGTNNGTTDDAVIGVSNADGGFGGGWFINNSDNINTSAWEPASTPVGVLGETLESAEYHAGVFGSADGGSINSASVFGQMGTSGTVNATGALGYRQGSGSTYHGGYFYATSSGADHSDGTFRNANNTNNQFTNVGSGSRGDLIGSWGKGDLYGMVASGNRVGLYVDGREFTNDISTQIHTNSNGERTATFVATSTNVDISTRGNDNLTNGTKRIPFNKDFSNVISSRESINVTITPIGESNGIHIVSVDNSGFTVKENNNGTSNVKFNWVAIGTKLGYEKVNTPKELLEKDFDTRLNQFLESAAFYAEKLNIKPGEMWWDGSQMRYSNTPYVKSNIEYKKKELPKEMSHPQKEEIKKSTFSKRPVK